LGWRRHEEEKLMECSERRGVNLAAPVQNPGERYKVSHLAEIGEQVVRPLEKKKGFSVVT